MSYIDGFVIAVPRNNRDAFIQHAEKTDQIFLEFGARRIMECWEDDVPDGTATDFRRAVQAGPDEAIVLSWIEWPDKATRDSAMARLRDPANSDPRMDPAQNPIPFDGKRMIFGGFTPVVVAEA